VRAHLFWLRSPPGALCVGVENPIVLSASRLRAFGFSTPTRPLRLSTRPVSDGAVGLGGHLPSAALNQAGTFQLPGSVRDGRPLDTQHFGEQVLSDLQCVMVTTVTHHE